MPDGLMLHIAPTKLPAAIAKPRLRFGLAALVALGLHGAAMLPFVLAPTPPPPTVVEDVEMAPATEAAAPQLAAAASFAESVAAAEAEPLQATALPEPPQAVPPPPETLAPPPPEPLQAEPPPPEPVLAEAPQPVQAEVPPDELVTAELPLPPPQPPAPPPAQRAVAPRPTPRPGPQPLAAAAPAAAASAAAPLPPAPTIQPPPPSYVGALMAALERHKDYPSTARWRRAEGVAMLRFSMRRDGTVSAWRVERSSGHADLDEAVERMIRHASPLPAPPAGLPGDPVELMVPVRFSLR